MSEQEKHQDDPLEPVAGTPEADTPTDEVSPETIEAADEIIGDTPAGEEKVSDPQAEIAELNDKLLRTLAETENLRRRAQREREDTAKYAVSNFARDMLSVADNLQRALASLPDTPAAEDDPMTAFADGVKLTERELQSIFERHGIEKIEPQGQKFDHDKHEAMFEMPTADAPPGTVVQVFDVGYMLKERLLRAAKVAVAKALPQPDDSERIDTKV